MVKTKNVLSFYISMYFRDVNRKYYIYIYIENEGAVDSLVKKKLNRKPNSICTRKYARTETVVN